MPQNQTECPMCSGEPEPGWIETDNNGPYGPCPGCNPLATKEGQIEAAWQQRDSQTTKHRRLP
jgi:hypothetical protein